ncbi:lipoyl(octanoyl) transferase LipB [Candidatus Endoriftia persephone]|jgi:lipoyl(octanoyl) transferase|uniref:Octanoyltransferase n=3 Tax=Gammaproteobacteria TaxID=1236 RepID=G2FG47_9GAMM|nr:lipoyl(octanoyl) transferase LipB [Candidatus Endoriftia persephone]EGV51105.1 octanoyltransferase [endosymbiont of Riftia pachyptila (vent Ph05)]EGW54280.1 octanoyltransferase [endosymbiont of Tevnia jerichonana (vent Tica)]USF87421.1 lipoyl(octanoyl) transferase LipB [Candidatus Endoriftia persephone]
MNTLLVRELGVQPYLDVWQAMCDYTEQRDPQSTDQLWLLQHPPVFTLGQAGKPEHLLNPGEIPIVQSDRGGQVTYHGPGQLIAYLMLDLRRAKLGVRALVTLLEQSVIELLAKRGITSEARADAPGVYVEGRKIAALGLRVRRGCSYHGLSLNVAMETEPFSRINPCGYPGLAVTQLSELGCHTPIPILAVELAQQLADRLEYTLRFDSDTSQSSPDE